MVNDIVDAYLDGVRAFHEMVDAYDARNAEPFGGMVSYGTKHFGIRPRVLVERLEFTKGTVSKWAKGAATPSLPVRAAVRSIFLEELADQIANPGHVLSQVGAQ